MNTQLCFCHQPPRWLLEGVAVCGCKHLVYRKAATEIAAIPSFAPVSPFAPTANTWAVSVDARTRRRLVLVAKHLTGDLPAMPAVDVRDAVAAARLAEEHGFANQIEFEQWIAGLEV